MTTTEIRQRATTNPNTMTSPSYSQDSNFDLPVTGGLSAKGMIDSSPQQHGVVLKLHVPIFYTILPEFLQRFILSFSFLSFLAPTWKQRYLILCGAFLYKFKDQSSDTPKGAPFDLETMNVHLVESNVAIPELGALPPGFTAAFSVSTLRRKHFYAVADKEEAMIWIRSVQDARQEKVTRNMGHAANVPYPKSWAYFDGLGRSLIKSKDRIRDKLEAANLREMEMSSFAEGGPLPRGYHG